MRENGGEQKRSCFLEKYIGGSLVESGLSGCFGSSSGNFFFNFELWCGQLTWLYKVVFELFINFLSDFLTALLISKFTEFQIKQKSKRNA